MCVNQSSGDYSQDELILTRAKDGFHKAMLLFEVFAMEQHQRANILEPKP